MYTFVWISGAIWETPSKKTAVILSHLYVIGVKIVLRDKVFLQTRCIICEKNNFGFFDAMHMASQSFTTHGLRSKFHILLLKVFLFFFFS